MYSDFELIIQNSWRNEQFDNDCKLLRNNGVKTAQHEYMYKHPWKHSLNLWPKTFLIRFNTLNAHNGPSTGNKMVQKFGPLFNFKISDWNPFRSAHSCLNYEDKHVKKIIRAIIAW